MKESSDFDMLMSCCLGNQKNFSSLIRLMRRNAVIPFLGAGFSANYGYPGWGAFLREQADEHNLQKVRDALKDKKYEKAATELKEQLGGHMEYALAQSFGDHIYKVSDRNDELEEIAKIFQSLILTTNFDEVIEMLYAKVNGEYIEKLTPKSLKDVNLSYKRIACGEPTLIKLHGDVAMREFVLTEQEYNEIYGNRVLDVRLPIPSFLRDILLSKVILFMGCSLEDDRTLEVIEQSQIDGSISFALLPLPFETINKSDPWKPNFVDQVGDQLIEKKVFTNRKSFLNAHNIIPIWYPNGEYRALKIFIKVLAYYANTEQNFSVTVVRDTLNRLMSDGDILKNNGNISQAFYSYAKAEEIVRRNPDAFTKEGKLQKLKKIKEFYDLNGYIYECRNIRKEIIELTEQTFKRDSVELALGYHDMGYAYERFRYYKLMLKAMQRSQEELHKCIESSGDKKNILNASAFIYISLGYAYLKNNEKENAIKWYQKAEELYNQNKEYLYKNEMSFLCNGLHRYYMLLNKRDEAIKILDVALDFRKELYCDGERDSAQHLINTYSNKIRIYLKGNEIIKARKEYMACCHEQDIWERLKDCQDTNCRILTDHGDILFLESNYSEAYEEFQRAIQYRKYLHFTNDKIIAEIYCKIANCLEYMDGGKQREKAIGYLIQAYIIYEKLSEENLPEVTEIKQRLNKLGEQLSYNQDILEQRLSVQREFLQYNYNERMDEQEEELIRFFEL